MVTVRTLCCGMVDDTFISDIVCIFLLRHSCYCVGKSQSVQNIGLAYCDDVHSDCWFSLLPHVRAKFSEKKAVPKKRNG